MPDSNAVKSSLALRFLCPAIIICAATACISTHTIQINRYPVTYHRQYIKELELVNPADSALIKFAHYEDMGVRSDTYWKIKESSHNNYRKIRVYINDTLAAVRSYRNGLLNGKQSDYYKDKKYYAMNYVKGMPEGRGYQWDTAGKITRTYEARPNIILYVDVMANGNFYNNFYFQGETFRSELVGRNRSLLETRKQTGSAVVYQNAIILSGDTTYSLTKGMLYVSYRKGKVKKWNWVPKK